MLQNNNSIPFQNPLEQLKKVCETILIGEIRNRFLLTYVKYENKLRHIFIIHQNIVRLEKLYKNFMNWQVNLTRKNKAGHHKFTSDEQTQFSQYQDVAFMLDFEIEDFFIHSRILMDDISRLAVFFFKNNSFLESNAFYHLPKVFTSFHYHKKWVKNEDVHKKYKELIKSTTWFDILLRDFRDDYFIHSPPRSSGTKMTPDGRISKVYWWTNLVDWEVKELCRIKQKYATMKDVPDNAYEILNFFDENLNLDINTEDLEFIKRVKKKGGELPDIQKIMKEILNFLEVMANIFSHLPKLNAENE